MAKPLIIFDSGIGGFSILRHLYPLPTPMIYYADSANFPYGDKDPSWVATRLKSLATDFKQLNPLGVVIACNTGTTTAISELRDILDCPVIGVEPVVKPVSHYKNPVIWGTTVTVNSERAQSLRATHGTHIRFYTPHNLALAIEHGDQSLIAKILLRAKDDLGSPDAIGLSCTHYPLIIDQIKAYFPNTTIIDPSLAVVTHIKSTLNLKPTNSGKKTKVKLITTGNLLELERNFAIYVDHS